MKLWDKISSLIGDEKSTGGQRPPARAKPQAGAAPKSVNVGGSALSPAAANTVLGMLPKGQSLDQFAAGQIQLLNIDSVKAELGDRWPKVEHQVHLLVEATLRRMLTDADIFTQISEFEYLVIFPNLSEQKAAALMFVAAAQIRQKLFGHDPAFAALRLNATVTNIDRASVENAADPIAAVHVATLLGQLAQPETAAAPEQPLIPEGDAAWTAKYAVIPIEGGGMTQGRMVTDARRAGSPMPDFAGLADRSQAASGAPSSQSATDAGGDSGQLAPAPGYTVVATTGSGRSENRMIQEAARPQTRLPDFSTVQETSQIQPPNAGGGSPAVGQASQTGAEPGLQIQGYQVVPTTGRGAREGQLVQSAPRAQRRMPDFSSANTPPTGAPQSAPAAAGNTRPPALAAQLDVLATKLAPQRAIAIGRPVDEQAVGSRNSESAAGSASSHPNAQIAPVEIEELQLLYEPTWDVRKQAVTAYRMKITLKVEGAFLGLNEFCVTYDDPKLQSTLNSVILHKLVSQMQSRRGEKNRATIVAPIGRRFIDDQNGLRVLLDQLNMLNDQERPLVVLEIGDAYFGSWPTLAPRLAMIRRVCRNLSVRLSLDHKDFQQIATTGATMVAGDLSDHDWPERQALSALNTFAAAASKATLRSFIGGLSTNSMVIAAVGAGFNHLSGHAIGDGTVAPLGIHSLSTEGFYLQRQAQRLQQSQGTKAP